MSLSPLSVALAPVAGMAGVFVWGYAPARSATVVDA